MRALKKEISLRQLFALGFGSIIGVGWITVLGAWLAGAGALGAMLAFAIGSIIVILIALCYAEMATRFPASGGEIVYLHEVFGLRLSFIAGWLLILGYVSVVVFEAISVGWILEALFPGIEGPELYSVAGTPVTLGGLSAGLLGMAGIAWVNIRGAKSAARLQEFMSFLLIGVTAVFCLAAFTRGELGNLQPHFVPDSDGLYWPGVAAILVIVPFFFSGFDVIPQAMGEKAEDAPMRGVPLVLALSIVAAGLFYIGVIAAAAMAMPRAELLQEELPVATAITQALGSSMGGKLVLFAGLLGLVTGWNSFTYGAARLLFALGRARIVFSPFGELHPRYRTPSRALFAISIVGAIGCFFGRGALLPIIDAGSLAFVLAYLAVCVAAFRVGGTPREQGFVYRMAGGQHMRTVAVVLTSALALYAFYLPYEGSGGGMPVEWSMLTIWLCAGSILYLIGKKDRQALSRSERSKLLLSDR